MVKGGRRVEKRRSLYVQKVFLILNIVAMSLSNEYSHLMLCFLNINVGFEFELGEGKHPRSIIEW